MVVQPDPGASLEVVEAEFLLELLVRLLATGSGKKRCGSQAPGPPPRPTLPEVRRRVAAALLVP
jgi:hypothetical protein